MTYFAACKCGGMCDVHVLLVIDPFVYCLYSRLVTEQYLLDEVALICASAE